MLLFYTTAVGKSLSGRKFVSQNFIKIFTEPHPYDIVEGPMANDTIFNYVQNFVDGKISREAFWALAKFKKPTHQISFHTENALSTLTFLKGCEVKNEE